MRDGVASGAEQVPEARQGPQGPEGATSDRSHRGGEVPPTTSGAQRRLPLVHVAHRSFIIVVALACSAPHQPHARPARTRAGRLSGDD